MAPIENGARKHAHLSEPDAEFAKLQPDLDKVFENLWSLPFDEFCNAWITFPPALPEDCPTEFVESHEDVAVADGTKVDVRIYTPKTDQKGRVLVFMTHGGGFVVGDHKVEEAACRILCVKNDAVVVSVDYRMAPKFKFPYAVTDSFDVLKWAKVNAERLGADPNRIVLGGSSAGGDLAAVLAQLARDEQLGGIIGQILNYPVTCHPAQYPKDKYELESFEQNAHASIVDKKKMMWFWDKYITADEAKDSRASPLLAESLENLPPALIQIAGMDPLRDEGIAYAEALKASGVNVDLKIYGGVPHGFAMLTTLKQNAEYNDAMVAFVKRVS